MTRKFVHLALAIFSLFLISCSIFDSGETQDINELEGETANLEEPAAEAEDNLEDLDLEESAGTEEETASTDTAGTEDDSFSDIEDFNEGLIENELSDNVKTDKPVEQAAASEELDLENANVQEPAAAPVITAPETVVEETAVATVDNAITNLEYKSQESGGTVVISAQKPFVYQVREEPQYNQTIIEVADVSLPERFKLPYIAKDFGQPVATVNAYQESGSTTARFVIQYKTTMKPSIQQRQNSLLVKNNNKPGSSGSYVTADSFDVTSKPSDVSDASVENMASNKSISGKKISLEFYGTDIKVVLQTIADEVGVNMIIDEEATGTVNVRLRNVEWEEGLSSILNAHGLGYERKGQILRIAKIKTITGEINDARERVKAETEAALLTSPKIMKIIPINYGDLDSLMNQISPLLSQTEKVTVDKRSNSLVVTGYPESVKRATQLVKSLDIEPLQVLIEGKIIEASNEFSKEFGIRWNSSTTFDISGQDATLSSTISGDNKAAIGGFVGDLSVGNIDLLGDLTALLSIFEREQKIKILSSPKVTALNKEKALIKQITQVPIFQTTLIPNAGSVNTVSFQDAELSLEVTPQVSFNADMILDIRVKRDIPGASSPGQSVQINKREASTKVIVKDGQSAVLGGIFSMDERHIEVGVPWLKDIPVLGYLFKSKRREVTKNELVIFLSPKILNPESSLKALEFSQEIDKSNTPEDTDMNSLENDLETL